MYILLCFQYLAFVFMLVLSAIVGAIGGLIVGPIAAAMWAFQTFSGILPNGSSNNDLDVI